MGNKDSNKSAEDRGDTPSASKIPAITLCRGSHLANKKFEWHGEREAATEGTLRHEIEEKQVPIEEIEDDERRACAIGCRRALRWCREDLGLDCTDTSIEREQRLWWNDEWSGQLDYLETWTKLIDVELQKHAFLADYKTLRFADHEPAPTNIQLLAQASLVVKNDAEVTHAYVALIQPFQDPTYTTASYSREYLMQKGEEFSEICREAMQENAPRKAGTYQCKWCSALPYCPEVRKLLKTTMEGKI